MSYSRALNVPAPTWSVYSSLQTDFASNLVGDGLNHNQVSGIVAVVFILLLATCVTAALLVWWHLQHRRFPPIVPMTAGHTNLRTFHDMGRSAGLVDEVGVEVRSDADVRRVAPQVGRQQMRRAMAGAERASLLKGQLT
ncbi:unnamed protein product [Protopolystoma xenopodis]|uniref:Uncharacterized protein n=1 Tax=Protopolystoma xenopodis TaxID=117903 RepID=A0A3S4ZMM2_9PLAT|nr:unnamed protein product [Protopolystoma xenopodis]